MRYKCLVFDHDDTVVNSTATIHHPSFLKYLAQYRPGMSCSLEKYFLRNFEPGFIPMCREDYDMTDADLDIEVRFWQEYVEEHIPAAYAGIREIMLRQKAEGGLLSKRAVVLQELYARGATIVSNEHGYGIYFRKEDTLYFVEMMADSDRAAEILMEAAREKEVIVEKAVITVGAAQPLFLGEGTRQEYGMIRFDAEPFDVSESYLRLMLEN